MVAQLTGFLCSLIHLNCNSAGFFSKSLFKGVQLTTVLQLSSLTVHMFLTAQIK